MKKNICISLVLLLFCFGNIPYATASHLMGAEITWTCVGQDSFMIKLVAYRDCNGISLSSTPISFKCATTGAAITSLNIAVGTPVDMTPVCKASCTRCQNPVCSFPYGIHRYTMQDLVILNSAGSCCSISISWSQGARSAAITTITTAGSSDLYIEEYLDRCQNPCDNSPSFTNPPIAILCVGQDFTFNHGVQDIDLNSSGGLADSLTYEWGHPMAGTANNIVYTGQYAYNRAIYFWGFPNEALPFPRGLHLDPQTGTIQFRPMKAEVTVMVVQVNEFRNGLKIAEIRRDMMMIVLTCTSNNAPAITTPNNVRTKSLCGGDSAAFTFTTNDPNTDDTLTISASSIPPGSVWTHTNGQSKHPTATLSWKATNADASPSLYTFYVTAKDNACPLSASYTQSYQFNVKFRLKGKVMVSDSGGGLFHFDLDTVYKEKPNYVLELNGTKHTLDSTQNFVFDVPGIYPYILKISYVNACNSITDTGVITNDTFLYVHLPADTSVCLGSSIYIEPKVFLSKGQVKYSWSTGDTNKILHTPSLTNNQLITLTVKDTTGHTAKRSIRISIQKPPSMIPADTTICYGSTLSIKPVCSFAKGRISYNWSIGDTHAILHSSRIFNLTGITLTVKDTTGCTVNNSINIHPTKNFSMLPDYMNACSGNYVNIDPDIHFTKGPVSYNWSTNDTVKILHTYRIYSNTGFSLVIADSTGCTIQDSTNVIVLRNPEITMDDKIYLCKKTSSVVSPSYQVFGNGNTSVFKWQKSGNQSVISTQNDLIVSNTGVYLFTVTDKFGCKKTDSISVVLQPASDTSLQVNGLKLTATAGMKKYDWYWNASLIGSLKINVFIAPYIGWYFAILTNSYDCNDTTRMVFIKSTGIDNQTTQGTMKLYPNPTTGKIMLQTTEQRNADIRLSVFNMVGREILNQVWTVNDHQLGKEIDISDQPAGIYTVIIRYQNSNFHELIIKE